MDVDALKKQLGCDRDEDLARRLNVPTSMISDVRRKHRKPSLRMAKSASDATGDPTYFSEALEARVA